MRLLGACQRRIEQYAGDDAEIRAVLADLEQAKVRSSRPMRSVERKLAYTNANAVQKATASMPRRMSR